MDACDSFGVRNFSRVNLGDRRRTRRLIQLADAMHRHPGGTLPDKLHHPPDLRAFYRLMDQPAVTHAVLMAGHADETRRRIAALPADSVVLRVHDATELDYTTKTTLRDSLGQIGQGTQRGYLCHNSLAVRADTGETLGLTAQILHHRADVPEGEGIKASRERADRESRLWVQGVVASGSAPAHVRCVDVSDSLSDTFEYIAHQVHHGGAFVLRARENRKLTKSVRGRRYVLDAARRLPAMGTGTVTVLASAGRRARTADVRFAFAPVTLAVPRKHLGEYVREPVSVWVVRVWEPQTPPGEELLEWILLTNVAVDEEAAARERVGWYQRRPIVEEYHKGMKTGCAIEAMQFETIARLEPAIAVLSAVTTTLLQLRDAARAPDADVRSATEVVDPEYVTVLSAYYGKRLGTRPSVLAFYLHVARLGGHQNRKSDGMPGWITLWRGWMKLQSMVDGHRAALPTTKSRCGKT
jgi:Transposase DNA-binding